MNARALLYVHLDLIPHPLSHGREIEVLSPDGITIQKRNSSARGMTVGRPVSCFQQPGAEQPEFHHFSTDAIDLYPVVYPDSVGSHQYEPAAEGQDEVLKDQRQSCSSQAENRRHLLWHTEDDEQDQQQADQLCAQVQNRFKCLFLTAIAEHPLQDHLKSPTREYRQHTDRGDHGERLQHQVDDDLVLYLDLLSPSSVQGDKLFLRSQAIVQDALDILLRRQPLQTFYSFGA